MVFQTGGQGQLQGYAIPAFTKGPELHTEVQPRLIEPDPEQQNFFRNNKCLLCFSVGAFYYIM